MVQRMSPRVSCKRLKIAAASRAGGPLEDTACHDAFPVETPIALSAWSWRAAGVTALIPLAETDEGIQRSQFIEQQDQVA